MDNEEKRHEDLLKDINILLTEIPHGDEEYLIFIKKLIKSYISLKKQHLL